jgi:HK97 gp10 family phage protein
MAKLIYEMPEDFLKKLNTLSRTNYDAIPKILQAGADVLMPVVKSKLQDVVGKNTKFKSESTGELVAALGSSPVKRYEDGSYNIKIGFSENGSKDLTNAAIANILEYGSVQQNPKPFLKPAVKSAKNQVLDAMQNAYLSEFL